MPINLILLIAALLVSWVIFRWLLTVIKSSVNAAIVIVVIFLLLRSIFGISPQELWTEIINLPETFQTLIQR